MEQQKGRYVVESYNLEIKKCVGFLAFYLLNMSNHQFFDSSELRKTDVTQFLHMTEREKERKRECNNDKVMWFSIY